MSLQDIPSSSSSLPLSSDLDSSSDDPPLRYRPDSLVLSPGFKVIWVKLENICPRNINKDPGAADGIHTGAFFNF